MSKNKDKFISPKNAKNRKLSVRKCIVCGKRSVKEDFIKITKNDKIIVNPDKYTFGRSVYICKNSDCISLSKKKKSFNRAFKTADADFIYDELILN